MGDIVRGDHIMSKQRPRWKKDSDPVDITNCPTGIDGLTFFSPQIPKEVIASVPLSHAADHSEYRKILKSVMQLFSSSCSGISDILAKVSLDDAGALFSGTYTLIATIIRNKVKLSDVGKDLTTMSFPAHAIEDIISAVRLTRGTLEQVAFQERIRFPQLTKFRWRIDITISSGQLSRIMRPSLLVQMILSNGEIKRFEISLEQFNQLRYGVARVLKDMQLIERHPIVRIVTDHENRDRVERCK